MQINIDTIKDELRLVVLLSQDASPVGTYVYPGTDLTKKLDDALLSTEFIKNDDPESLVITGTTDSKLYAILRYLKNIKLPDGVVKQINGVTPELKVSDYLNMEIRIVGANITSMITRYDDIQKEYTLYTDTDYPIKYIDFANGTTTFMFIKEPVTINTNSPLMVKYLGLIEEPKIDSTVFIDRGVLNVFEPVIKLKKIKSLNEMIKYGFGYYKINKEGFNF